MTSRYLFPLAFMLNAFAMTGILIILGLAGNNAMAAEVGIVQAATIALFYAFSANARSLMLNQQSPVDVADILYIRVLLLLPLSIAAYYLSSAVIEVELMLVLALIIRRAVEWLQEVHLSKAELTGDMATARQYVIYQSCLLALLIIWILLRLPGLQFLFLVWAIFPLFFELKYIVRELSQVSPQFRMLSQKLMPHLGSSLIIGISVYIFRLFIILITGKEMAGDLFTAFAIGGTFGSIFANALGASVSLNEARSRTKHFPAWANAGLGAFALLGLLIFLLAWFQVTDILLTFKSYFFFMALGLSMVGGTMMVYAQRLRFRLLLNDSEHDVFGPDVLMNVLLLAAIPFLFYIVGRPAMSVLYFLSAVLAYTFYLSAGRERKLQSEMPNKSITAKTRLVIASLLLLPVFFQLDGGLFTKGAMVYDPQGSIFLLPIPVSVLACYLGIILMGGFSKARESLGFIFFTFLLMFATTMLVSEGNIPQERDKFIFLIQFVLPMFALVLGQTYSSPETNKTALMEKAFLYVLVLVVPLELIQTWIDGRLFLSPKVYFFSFSIYQHLQYVPVILVSAYLIVLYKLGQTDFHKKILLILTPVMGVYAVASTSILALALFVTGLTTYVFLWVRRSKVYPWVIVAILALVLAAAYFMSITAQASFVAEKYSIPTRSGEKIVFQTQDKKLIPGLTQRLDYWRYYSEEITTDVQTFALGHAERPNRVLYPSAHNYYLDFIYNFGFLGLIPFIILIAYTILCIYKRRFYIFKDIGLLGLVAVVLILVLVDNSLKVGLRQPYPGIFTFFIWGILLSRLSFNTTHEFPKTI